MYATILTIGLLVIGQVRVESEQWTNWQEEVVVANTPSMWLGLTTELNAVGNWSDGLPGTGVDSIFGPADGDATTDTTIAALATLITRPDYKGDIGSSGNEVAHGTTPHRQIIRHDGNFYWGAASATNAAQIVINKRYRSNKIAELSGLCARLYVLNGRVLCTAIHSWGNPTTSTWMTIFSNQSEVVIDAASGAETLPRIIRMQAGSFENKRSFTDAGQIALMNGGTWLQTGTFKGSMVIRITGGVLRYEPATDPSGETPVFMVDGGILDVRKSQFAIPALIEIGPGGVLRGNAIDKQGGYYDVDFNEDYP